MAGHSMTLLLGPKRLVIQWINQHPGEPCFYATSYMDLLKVRPTKILKFPGWDRRKSQEYLLRVSTLEMLTQELPEQIPTATLRLPRSLEYMEIRRSLIEGLSVYNAHCTECGGIRFITHPDCPIFSYCPVCKTEGLQLEQRITHVILEN